MLTAKLKLKYSPEQQQALDVVPLACRDALNFTSEIAHMDTLSVCPDVSYDEMEAVYSKLQWSTDISS